MEDQKVRVEVIDEPRIYPLDEAQAQFIAIGEKWRELRRETGEFLLEWHETLTSTEHRELQLWIKREYLIDLSEQAVCMRVARGEVPETVASKVRPSTLRFIPTAAVPDPEQEYQIHSPDNGGVVTKKFRDFTSSEIRANVTRSGIVGPTSQSRPVTSYRAKEFRLERGDLILVVPASNPDRRKREVRITVTASLIETIQSAQNSA